MEKKTKKDNRNSSLPSSQTDKNETSTHSGANGKGKGHNGALSGNTRTVETIQVANVTDCEGCGEDLDDTPVIGHERRTKIDIIFEYVWQLHRALEAWEQSAIEQLLQMPALHADETSLRVVRKKHWIHVYSASDITLKRLHPKRGLEAIENIGIILDNDRHQAFASSATILGEPHVGLACHIRPMRSLSSGEIGGRPGAADRLRG